ncbi:CoA-binding protein [Cuniculiplasma sp. SKW3]|uniref:CoA-binding protein n=1 Tax=unclassified Cuniculiplasma TaxID=2619706 RepID=UPI003FD68C48
MEEQDKIRDVLKNEKNVAVVGISEKPDRDSYRVAKYLIDKGYNVIPINPSIEKWNGIKSYSTVSEAGREHRIDVVDIFRKPEAVPEIVRDSLGVKPKTIWMQIGVKSDEGKKLAEENGIKVIMDRCMMEEHKKL